MIERNEKLITHRGKIEPHSVGSILRDVFSGCVTEDNIKQLNKTAPAWMFQSELSKVCDYLMMFYQMDDKTFEMEIDSKGRIPLRDFLKNVTSQLNIYTQEKKMDNKVYSAVLSKIDRFSNTSIVRNLRLQLQLYNCNRNIYPPSDEVKNIGKYIIK